MIVDRRSSLRRSRISDSTSKSDLCLQRRKKWRRVRPKAQVHIVGVSSLAAGHLALVPALKRELGKLGLGATMIVVGGVIPAQDFAALREAGADAIFPPGTVIAEAAQDLLERLNDRLGYRQRAPV